jgi:hypothetical protein
MQELSPRGQIDGSRRVCEDVAVLRGLISSTYYLKFELQIREREREVFQVGGEPSVKKVFAAKLTMSLEASGAAWLEPSYRSPTILPLFLHWAGGNEKITWLNPFAFF